MARSTEGERFRLSDFVPRTFRPGLVTLRDLSGEDAARLIAAVRDLPAFLPLDRLAEEIKAALPPEPPEAEGEVVNSLISLRVQLRNRESLDDLLDQVVNSASIAPAEPHAREAFRERLAALLSADGIATTASAADVLVQYERPFRSARIFTDIRPVFADDVAETPKGAVLVETLQIDYWTRDGGREVVTFGLDENDLGSLKQVVDRAIEKSATMRRFLEAVDVAVFTPGTSKDNET